MRYAGGMLGGTWLASFAADLGDGKFDGALPGPELREPESGQHVLGQVLPPVRERRHRAAALPRVRALVGRLLPHEPRGDRVDHANLFVGNKLWSGEAKAAARQGVRPARHQVADHPVRVDGRQHHAAAAGVQLGRRRLRLDRGDQGARPGHRRPAARGHRPPRHLRLRQGGEEGARADRLGAEVDRGAAARPLRHGDPRAQGRRRQASSTRSSFIERRLEDIAARFNRFERDDEKPFEAVAAVSEFNQRAYELFAQPLVQSMAQRGHARSSLREFHPLRVQRWAFSDLNPWLAWLRAGGAGGQGAAPGAGGRTTRRARSSR